jgi:transposase-like protein
MTEKREKREFTDEFKNQMVQLYNNGKGRTEIAREYDLTPSALNNWIKGISGSYFCRLPKSTDSALHHPSNSLQYPVCRIQRHQTIDS